MLDYQLKLENVLSLESLSKLIHGEILGIQVPGYYAESKCKRLAHLLTEQLGPEGRSSGGIYESDVDSFWNTLEKPELRIKYLSGSIPTMRRARQLMVDHLYPSDLFRLELDELWPAGATLMRIDGSPMLFGITRRWKEGSEGLPHQDILWREYDNQSATLKQRSQLGINIYLTCPEEGGELETWDYSIPDEQYQSYLKKGIKHSYGFDRKDLPEQSFFIKPQIGDLILINTTKIHAIRKTKKGERITVSGFVGYFGDDQSLRLWS